VLGKPFYEAAQ